MHYRNLLNNGFSQAKIVYKHSNLLIGFHEKQMTNDLVESIVRNKLVSLYAILEDYITKNPEFEKTHLPWRESSGNEFIDKMIESGRKAGVGPMAAVAGAFADELASELSPFLSDMWIENGGDIAMKSGSQSRICIYGGTGGFEEDVYLKIPPGYHGVASSSAKFGHSFSKGKADIVTVAADNAAEADAYATAICNKTVPENEPEDLLEEYRNLKSVTIIWNKKLYHIGEIELDFN